MFFFGTKNLRMVGGENFPATLNFLSFAGAVLRESSPTGKKIFLDPIILITEQSKICGKVNFFILS